MVVSGEYVFTVIVTLTIRKILELVRESLILTADRKKKFVQFDIVFVLFFCHFESVKSASVLSVKKKFCFVSKVTDGLPV